MLTIYICEDNVAFQQEIQKTIESYVMIQAYDMKVALATIKPQKVLDALANEKTRNAYFLDVDLKDEQMNGFDLGKAIRKVDPRGFIIFITDHSELLAETFKYRLEAMDFIIKGDLANIQKRVQECLDSVQERLFLEQKETRRYFPIKMSNEVFYVAIDEIYFIETSPHNHKVLLYAKNQQLDFFGNLQDLEEELGEGFLRVHRSYLVNTKQIKQVDYKTNTIFFEDELSCFFTRRKKKMLQELLKQ
ncbi:LytR/AlgR family response regulator transcription factor [Candidatus Enterococcus ferrettii]|uniref:Two-component system, LytTR family, response regulator AgrA n=1 Tax=Candidatus Enterococcus ferrettii TaxID=2815324 RepID=A0ABV0EXX8_9ENTE|nr:LytTR family DNA-binding domain-containing protein [Enterococcus sp. 665A]MBO1341686.1 response regulator transcription factor [Enterococcus sp. 665A]